MASRENKKLFPLKHGAHGEGKDSSDYSGVDTCETISQEFDSENESNFETPNNNSWVNYEGRHDFEGIPINSDRFCVDFDGFKSKESGNVERYKNKYHNMLQDLNEDEEIQDELLELKNPDDSDIDVDLGFDFDFSGFESNDGVNLKDYKDKFINMVRNETYEKEEKEN